MSIYLSPGFFKKKMKGMFIEKSFFLFLPTRVQLFSGGQEAVLVQWNLSKGTKAFLPRLGAPLQVQVGGHVSRLFFRFAPEYVPKTSQEVLP